ncbi:hypothetical protein WJX74_006342 [Apatococcus lobatus]
MPPATAEPPSQGATNFQNVLAAAACAIHQATKALKDDPAAVSKVLAYHLSVVTPTFFKDTLAAPGFNPVRDCVAILSSWRNTSIDRVDFGHGLPAVVAGKIVPLQQKQCVLTTGPHRDGAVCTVAFTGMASPLIVVDTLDSFGLSAIKQSLEESASLALLRQGRPVQLGICKVLRHGGANYVELQVLSRKAITSFPDLQHALNKLSEPVAAGQDLPSGLGNVFRSLTKYAAAESTRLGHQVNLHYFAPAQMFSDGPASLTVLNKMSTRVTVHFKCLSLPDDTQGQNASSFETFSADVAAAESTFCSSITNDRPSAQQAIRQIFMDSGLLPGPKSANLQMNQHTDEHANISCCLMAAAALSGSMSETQCVCHGMPVVYASDQGENAVCILTGSRCALQTGSRQPFDRISSPVQFKLVSTVKVCHLDDLMLAGVSYLLLPSDLHVLSSPDQQSSLMHMSALCQLLEVEAMAAIIQLSTKQMPGSCRYMARPVAGRICALMLRRLIAAEECLPWLQPLQERMPVADTEMNAMKNALETSHLDGLSLLDYQSNLPQHLQRALEAAPVSIPPPEPPPPSIPHPSLDQLQSKPIFKHPQAPGNAQRAKRKSDITTAEPCSERLSGLKVRPQNAGTAERDQLRQSGRPSVPPTGGHNTNAPGHMHLPPARPASSDSVFDEAAAAASAALKPARSVNVQPVASKKGGSAQPFKRIKSSRLRLN